MLAFMLSVTMLLLSMAVFVNRGLCKKSDQADWLDPLDMIYYDPNRQVMTNKQSVENQEVDPVDNVLIDDIQLDLEKLVPPDVDASIYENCLAKLNSSQQEILALNDTVTKLLGSCAATNEQNFFRQYVRSLVQRFKNLARQSDGHYVIDVKLHQDQYKYLQDYGDGGQGSVQEIHTILLAMLSTYKWSEDRLLDPADDDQTWHVYKQYLETVVKVAGLILMLTISLKLCQHLPRSVWWISTRLLLVLFVISVPWNWWLLYKKEIATKHASMYKEMPDSCRTNRQSFWTVIQYLIRGDECARYYENVHVDPVWEVAPTKALAVTITKFFLEPAQHVGAAVNKLMVAAFADLPFHLWIPVLSLILLLTLLMFFFCFRYRVRTLLFNIEPGYVRDNAEHVQRLTHTIEQQKVELMERTKEIERLTLDLRQTQAQPMALDPAPVAGSLGEGDCLLLPVDSVKFPVVCSDAFETAPSHIQPVDFANPDIDFRISSEDFLLVEQ